MTLASEPKQIETKLETSLKGIRAEESLRRNQGGGIIKEEAGRRNHGGGIKEEESRKKNHGGIKGEESGRMNQGRSIRQHLGAVWGHLGGLDQKLFIFIVNYSTSGRD